MGGLRPFFVLALASLPAACAAAAPPPLPPDAGAGLRRMREIDAELRDLLDRDAGADAGPAFARIQGEVRALRRAAARDPEAMDAWLRAHPGALADGTARRAFAALRSAEEFSVPRCYAGKYGGDPRIEAACARLEEAWPRARALLGGRLGDPALALPDVVVLLVDREGSDLEGTMGTGLAVGGRHPVAVIGVAAELQVVDAIDDVVVLAHELVHAAHLAAGGLADGTPPWVGEGLAHWIEGEEPLVELVRDWSMADLGAGPGPAAVADLLRDAAFLESAHPEDQRVAGAVLFFQVERRIGSERFRGLARALLAEPDARAVLERETGLPLDRLVAEAGRAHREWAARTFEGRDDLDAAARDADGGDFPGALAALDRFLGRFPASPLRPVAEFLKVDGLRMAGDLEEALAAARAFRADHPRCAGVGASMLVELEALAALGRWDAAAALARPLLRDRFWSQDGIRDRIGALLAEAEARLGAPRN